MVGSKSPRRYEVSAPARQRVADDELELPRLVSAVQGARAIVALQEQTALGSALERKRYDGRGALDEGAVRDAFASYGEITEAVVITDRETSRSRGFGFVTFANDGDAASAISGMNGQDLDGRSLNVNEAQDRQRPGGRDR